MKTATCVPSRFQLLFHPPINTQGMKPVVIEAYESLMNQIQLNDLQNKKIWKLLFSITLGGVSNLEQDLQETQYNKGYQDSL